MRDVVNFLHSEIATLHPHFGVPLLGACIFAWLMEQRKFSVISLLDV
ncbi:hypothetical protein MNBD_GAMMA22-2927 [hydrothermal vent metagenome]|uniref:Uncharacterized protein n=1 Tax=hydrothermal vent metagenome TaxID=652676 RepID=A0A3B1AIH8_9ZZZZ